MSEYKLGDVARISNVSVRTLHDYDEIGDPRLGAEEHLRREQRLLRERLAQTQLLLAAIEHEMEARQMGISLTPEEQLEVFGTDRVATRTSPPWPPR